MSRILDLITTVVGLNAFSPLSPVYARYNDQSDRLEMITKGSTYAKPLLFAKFTSEQGRASQKGKKCFVVPPAMYARLNKLLALQQDLSQAAPNSPEEAALSLRLEAAQKQYTKRVELFLRQEARCGMSSRPSYITV
ncbi:hypothetical protein B7463_g3590, partial [Scytalidium lignicola]